MNDLVLWTAIFFAAIMVAVITAGYYYLRRQGASSTQPEGEPDAGARFSDSPLPSTQATLARALQFM